MRSTRRSKSDKNSNVHKNIKRKHRNRSRGIFSWSDDMSGLFLDDINEVLRENKARRAECNGSWKVLPKDSCEVYKNRRKRLEINRQKQQNAADSSNYTDSRYEYDECRSGRRSSCSRQPKKKLPTRRFNVKDKKRKRYGSESTTSISSSTISTTDTSNTEMDYE